jgi:Ca2+/Na+ antiporter
VSNASLIIAAYNYSKKRTNKGVSVALSSLLGAAIMNNTFVLGTLLFVVLRHGIQWDFMPEVVGIVSVLTFICSAVIFKSVHTMTDAWVFISLYPLSLFLVYLLR